jgi:lipoprotein-anchoring transpeptidase ErfK/SrfK
MHVKESRLAARTAGAVRATMTFVVFAVCTGVALAGFAPPAFADTDTDTGTGTVPSAPCVVTAKACVDLTTQRAWLMNAGAVTRGPVPIGSGGPGEETPTGTFKVLSKDKNHKSAEQGGTPMPYSVFFAPGGVAFHGGDLRKASAGCVHMQDVDAIAFFNTLQIGDQVQVLATPPPRPRPRRRQPPPTSSPAPALPTLNLPSRPRN